jgi:4-hydroxy-tetrahydrodipicolinate synthase
MPKWDGVFAYPVSTFDDGAERLDLEAFAANLEYMIDSGVHYIVPLGSTGEFAYLSPDERREIVSTAVKQVRGRIPVIAGVSAISTKETVRLAREAKDLGADGLTILMQCYFALSDDQVLAHLEAVSRAVDLPILIYNNPGTSKVDFTPALVKRLPDVAHVEVLKESSGNINRVNLLREAVGGKLTILAGWDTIALPSFALGLRGWCSGLPNIAARECVDLYELAVERNDPAGALDMHRRLFPLAEYLLTNQIPAVAKAGMEIRGRRGGPPRPPLSPLPKGEIEKLRAMIDRLGVPAAV